MCDSPRRRSVDQIVVRDAEQAARDLLSGARSLVEIRRDNVPAVLVVPNELATLVDAAGDAMAVAAAMQMALGASDIAVRNLDQVASTIGRMREHLTNCVLDPALVEHRVHTPLAPDAAVLEAATSLKYTQHWLRGRASSIAAGLVASGKGDELEAVAPMVGLAFEVVEANRAL